MSPARATAANTTSAPDVIAFWSPVDYTGLSVSDLLKSCLDSNNEAAWEEFVRRFQRTIAGAICKTLRSFGSCDPELVNDLVQDTFMRLCADRSRSLREFEATEEVFFHGFLKATAVNVVRDHFRRVRSIKRHADAVAEPIDTIANERASAQEHEKKYEDSLILQAVDEILRFGEPAEAERNRFIFWLHYRDGFSAAEIARMHPVGLSAKGVETVLRRLLNEVKRGDLSAGRGGGGIP